MLPWESSVAIFGQDERYAKLNSGTSIALQHDIFEEYCKEVIKERKDKASAPKAEISPMDAYRDLLRATVTSTRMTYTQFRQQVKKDRRFYSYGRDEKERERMFRWVIISFLETFSRERSSYLKELGEEKRSERQRVEEAFLLMLKEGRKSGLFPSSESSKWADVKKQLQKDPRYDAVGSSRLREELFETFIKTITSAQDDLDVAGASQDVERLGMDPEDDRKRRQEKAVREREEKVRRTQAKLEEQNALSRAGLNLEEAELAFKYVCFPLLSPPMLKLTICTQKDAPDRSCPRPDCDIPVCYELPISRPAFCVHQSSGLHEPHAATGTVPSSHHAHRVQGLRGPVLPFRELRSRTRRPVAKFSVKRQRQYRKEWRGPTTWTRRFL